MNLGEERQAFEAWLARSNTQPMQQLKQPEPTLWEKAGFVKTEESTLVSVDSLNFIYGDDQASGFNYSSKETYKFDCTVDELLASIARARGRT